MRSGYSHCRGICNSMAQRADLNAARGLEVRRIDEIDNFNDIDGLAALVSVTGAVRDALSAMIAAI